MKIKELKGKSYNEAFDMVNSEDIDCDKDYKTETIVFYLDDGQAYFYPSEEKFKLASIFKMSELIETGNKILSAAGIDHDDDTWQDIPKSGLLENQINLIDKLTDLMYAVEEAQISDW